jgi:tetratricopeptide (TPR) repeat protein
MLLVLLGLLVYANSLHVPFQFDDDQNIVHNPIIKDLSYFSHPERAQGLMQYSRLRMRYVGFLTLALNYRIHGLRVEGYHAVNIAIHIVNALLLYLFVLLSFRTPGLRGSPLAARAPTIALLSAALFVVHPVQTQAVTYIVQRLASLTALFYLGAMASYARSRLSAGSAARWGFYLLCLSLSVLAMKTKQNAFTLPLAIALYEVLFFRGEPWKKRAALLAPLLLTMLIIPLTLLRLDKLMEELTGSATGMTQPTASMAGHLLTELRVAVTYLRLLVLPVNQNVDYDYPLSTSMPLPSVLASLIVVLSAIALALWLLRKRGAARLAAFGVLFFFLALSVESVVPWLMPMYEHRLYLPVAGLFMAASVGVVGLAAALPSAAARKALGAACVIALLCFGTLAAARNTVWKSPFSLWGDTVAKSPRKARPNNNLGMAWLEGGDMDRAMRYLKTSVALEPTYAPAYNNIGYIYYNRGELDRAREAFQLTLKYMPKNSNAHYNLGNVYFDRKRLDDAIAQYQRAIALRPDYARARYNLGNAYFDQGKFDRALASYRKVIAITPDFAPAYNNIGSIHAMQGRPSEALRYFRKALELDPSYTPAIDNLRQLLQETGGAGR